MTRTGRLKATEWRQVTRPENSNQILKWPALLQSLSIRWTVRKKTFYSGQWWLRKLQRLMSWLQDGNILELEQNLYDTSIRTVFYHHVYICTTWCFSCHYLTGMDGQVAGGWWYGGRSPTIPASNCSLCSHANHLARAPLAPLLSPD